MNRCFITSLFLGATCTVHAFVPVPQMPNLLRSFQENMQNSFILGVSSFIDSSSAVASPEPSSSVQESPAISPRTPLSFLEDMKGSIMNIFDQPKQNAANEVLNMFGGGNFRSTQRSEVLITTQVFGILLVHILTGGLPVVGDALNVLFGPALMTVGSSILTQSFLDNMGGSSNGLYSHVRNPIFVGILAIMAGYSVVTSSAPRLIATAALTFALDQFTNGEEESDQCKADVDESFFSKELSMDRILSGLMQE